MPSPVIGLRGQGRKMTDNEMCEWAFPKAIVRARVVIY